ncbi:uncharacterized protein LOC127244761 isoform X2 [Andrographis paniculata]|uniref:uncharacterized protein LOC127244761 isoform X2 n=1 Tax=Andrographis paniculata TaxID=175694 RepID=UPI0021E7C40F|nr:uncharacterized protein LOC127244761 isoform X2 [Andrographis paniculata]
MNIHCLISTPQTSTQRLHHHAANCFNSRIARFGCGSCSYIQLQRGKSRSWNLVEAKKNNIVRVRLRDGPAKFSKKKGSVSGAVALIVGTSIGSGILALPKKISAAGLLPSSITMTMCWAFMLFEAMLLVEINVSLLRKEEVKVKDELKVISITTMAQETLGEWGGVVATMAYVFLGYTSMIAYGAKSGEIIHHITGFPEATSEILFTVLFTVLISIGGTRATGQVNQWLTVSMIGLLIAIESLAAFSGGWSGLEGGVADWEKVPATLPVMIFTLAYHDLSPVLCAYLGGDLKRIRAAVFLGSVVPLVAYLIWDAIALSLSNQLDQVSDPVELLLSVEWEGVPSLIEVFSLLAVGTSLIGTLLAFSEFFKEQITVSLDSLPAQLEKSGSFLHISNWWQKNKTSITATAMVITPSLLVSTTVPDAFSAATDIAGGYCMTMLYGVLPPAMAWAMNNKKGQGTELPGISKTGPVVISVGLFACGVVLEQLFRDFSSIHP